MRAPAARGEQEAHHEPGARVRTLPELLGQRRGSAKLPEHPGRRPGRLTGPLQAPGTHQVGERVRDPEQVGVRQQLVVDPLLQQREEIAHPLELPFQRRRFAVARTAGVHHGQGQVVRDVRMEPGERELHRAYAGVVAVLEQRPPALRRLSARLRRVERRQIPLREPCLQGTAPSVFRPRDRQPYVVEDPDPVSGRPSVGAGAHCRFRELFGLRHVRSVAVPGPARHRPAEGSSERTNGGAGKGGSGSAGRPRRPLRTARSVRASSRSRASCRSRTPRRSRIPRRTPTSPRPAAVPGS